MPTEQAIPVEYVFIESQGTHYPKKCSFCTHFREVWDGKVTKDGLPMPNVHTPICEARSEFYGGYMQSAYVLQEHDVLPYQQLHAGCGSFKWQKRVTG